MSAIYEAAARAIWSRCSTVPWDALSDVSRAENIADAKIAVDAALGALRAMPRPERRRLLDRT